MRILMWHVDRFRCAITEKGRSPVVEELAPSVTEMDEGLVVLTSVEKGDEEDPETLAQRGALEIGKLCRQLKVKAVVLHPFAHLFGELSAPATAMEALKGVAQHLEEDGFAVSRTPFGWFNTLEIRAKGHPLSRVARVISAST